MHHKPTVLLLLVLCLMTAIAQAEDFTFWAQEDAWVNQDNPAANYGSSTYLTVKDRSSFAETYLKFSDSDLNKLSGLSLLGASLYLYQYQGTYSPGDTVNAYKAASSWEESALTWDNRPAHDPLIAGSLNIADNVTEGWREWGGLQQCVGSWLQGNNYGLLLENNQDAKSDELFARFYSSEAANFKPYLKVTAAPEPVGMLLFGIGAGVFGVARRTKKRLL